MKSLVPAQRLLVELDEVDAAMGAAIPWIASLQLRRHQLVGLLDEATRPATVRPTAAAPTIIHRGVQFQGKLRRMWNFIDIYLFVLKELWSAAPDRRDAIAEAMGHRGTVRRYVAKDRRQLFLGKSDLWVLKHSVALTDGWYADTNLSVKRMRVLLPVAVRAAGWRWGEEVHVFWRPTLLN